MTGIHPASDRTISPAFVMPEDWRAHASSGYGPDMTRTRKFVAILTIVGASLGAAAPSAVVAVSNGNGAGSSVETIGKLGGGRPADPINAIGKLGGGRASDAILSIGKLGGGSPGGI